MLWCRMCWIALRLCWPHLLTPWRSPLLRWRMETYGVVDERGALTSAQAIGAGTFLRFVLRNRRALGRFLRWAAELDSLAR